VVQHQLHPAELELFDTSARASGIAYPGADGGGVAPVV
jgi:hypothetical protein